MADLFAWLLSSFLVLGVLCILLDQFTCLVDVEADYVNPFDSSSRINKSVVPEFVMQGSLCFLHLVTGHWFMFMFCLPYLFYNLRLYTQRRHLVDVTEIFSQLPWLKKQRIYKLVYLAFLLTLSVFWMILKIVELRD